MGLYIENKNLGGVMHTTVGWAYFHDFHQLLHVLPVNNSGEITFPHVASYFCICKPEFQDSYEGFVHFPLDNLYRRIPEPKSIPIKPGYAIPVDTR